MLHGDKVLGKMMPEVIGKTHYMLLSSKRRRHRKESNGQNILEDFGCITKKEMSSGENWPFFCKQILKGKTCPETLGL